jgi:predicted ATPase/DNA-binding CsgD family transcriptional regulator
MATHDVPPQLTTFVGRKPELDAISGLLEHARLVTVAGPGGCGKTRLAVEAANRQADRRPHGTCWVDLASTSDPGDVPELLAAATGVLLPPDRQAGPSLVRQLADRQLLVCLDNCEHVLGAAAEIAAELLRTCPGVTLLATSREPLGVAGEIVWRVPPLSGDDAVDLFEERSGHAVRSEESAEAVRVACIRLDGIPLAVELAAAWSGTLSAAEILQGLDDRFALLIRGPRGVPARHQTLAASMAWSHDLLDEADRVLFRRLGVFPGGFTLKVAQGVCAVDADEPDVLSGLRRLVDKSLVVADTRGSIARYRMLETIRQYAVARLDEAGEREATQDRHLDTFLAVTDEAAPLLDVDKDAWRAAIGAESENLRTAVEWGLSRDDAERGRRLAAALPWLWHLSARGHDGLALLRLAITKDSGARTDVQARLLTGLALVADTTRPDAVGHAAAAAALEIATEVGDERTACLAQLLTALSFLHRDLDGALSLAETAHERASAAGDAFVSDGAMALVGIIWHLRDEHQRAIPVLQKAVDGLVLRGDRGVASTAIGFMACSVLYTGDVARAKQLAVQGVQVARPLADYHRLGSALGVLAMVEGITGHVDDGRATLDLVLRSVEGADSPPFVPGLSRTMGFLQLWSRRPDQAASWFRREAGWWEGVDDAASLSPQTLLGLVAALRLVGDTEAATERCEQAVATARLVGMPRVLADALEQSALLLSETDARRAEDLHHEALALRVEHGLRLFYVDSLEAIAGLAARAESFTEAVRLLGASDLARTQMSYPRTTALAADVDALRETLGPDAYDAAWEQGRALSLDEAVNAARRGRGTRGRPSSGWASLTPTEHSVVRLVVDGSSNPEIGTRLFMSRSTVKTHLSHVYAKLGVANRTELATFAGPHLADD